MKDQVYDAIFAAVNKAWGWSSATHAADRTMDALWPLIETALSEARRDGAREGLTRFADDDSDIGIIGFRNTYYPAPRAPETVTLTCARCEQADSEFMPLSLIGGTPLHASEAECISALGRALAARSQGAR